MINKLFEKHLTSTILVLAALFGAGLVFLRADLDPPEADASPAIFSFTANPSSINPLATTTLSWDIGYVNGTLLCKKWSFPANGQWSSGYVVTAKKSSKSITNVGQTTTFIMNCKDNTSGTSGDRTAKVTVSGGGGGGGGGGQDY